ncbi:acyl-CoA dehydrogenase family protein [Belnapia sp. T18]|uniref:Acyl-CoA dehydrogenase family protein n=1 Tax=Belnapia arida TaxID=2804533 RepID=A0ABS1TWB1_9PROT|nr:acyl-CoA dehydrogenase family protein [Belnapia arida]MBL6076485.1 acyl-CoA dehydrogenase family protein [Belnapia arida]
MRQAEAAGLRRELRSFLSAAIAAGEYDPAAGSFGPADPGFAARLGARGWLGICWPRALGGQEGSALDRHVIAEELIAHGAPLRASWVAEWLAGPLLLAAGTPEQQRELLPRFAAGRLSACIGLTEAALPGSGAPRCLARPDRGGWRLGGRCQMIGDPLGRLILLARTGDDGGAGLSLFLVDLALPGIAPLGAGRLAFDGVFLAGDRLLGPPEAGLAIWQEVAGIARGAPGGWLRHLPLLAVLAAADGPPEAEPVLGRLLAGCATMQAIGLARAGRAAPRLAALAAAEAEAIPAALYRLLPGEARPAPAEPQPVLPPVPGLRRPARPPHPLAAETARLLDGRLSSAFDPHLWAALEEGPVLRAALPPELGGDGEGLPGLLAIAEAAGAAGAPLPIAETLLGHHALALAGLAPPIGPLTFGPVLPDDSPGFGQGLLAGRLHRLPWARHASTAVIVLEGRRTVLAGRPAIGDEGRNGAGEPRDLVLLEEMPVLAAGEPGMGLNPGGLRALGTLFRAAAMLGATGRLAGHRRSPALAAAARFALRRAAWAPGRFAIACARLRVHAAAEDALAIPGQDPALVRRIAAWSGEFGTESEWASWLGRRARRAGAAGLWPLIADPGRMPDQTEETDDE